MRAANTPRHAGRITTWKDEQGFGFITPNGGGAPVFVHIKSFAAGSQRPVGNEIVHYELTVNDKGQPRAANVAFYQPRGARQAQPRRGSARVWTACGFLGLLAVLVLAGSCPPLIPLVYLGMGVLTFGVYAADKSAARNGRWRTQESTLHLLGLAGGWPGALLAQHFLRHKSTKQSFQVSFWFTVAVNCGVLGWYLAGARLDMLAVV